MDGLKKKIENIWFYYKVPIIIIGIIIIVTLDIMLTTKSEPEYDQSIGIVATTFPSEENVDTIRQAFENKYNETFKVETYKIDFNSNIIDEIESSRLDLDLRNSISKFIIVEDIDGFKKATNKNDWDVALIGNIDFLKGNGADNYYLIIRK